MVFHWSLGDRKSSQVSGTLLSMLADLNNAVWISTVHSPISNSSHDLTKSLQILPSASVEICTNVTLVFNIIFNPQARSKFSSLFSFSLTLTAKFFLLDRFSFFVDYYLFLSSGRDLMICLYLKISVNFCASFSSAASGLCIYLFFSMVKFQFLV